MFTRMLQVIETAAVKVRNYLNPEVMYQTKLVFDIDQIQKMKPQLVKWNQIPLDPEMLNQIQSESKQGKIILTISEPTHPGELFWIPLNHKKNNCIILQLWEYNQVIQTFQISM